MWYDKKGRYGRNAIDRLLVEADIVDVVRKSLGDDLRPAHQGRQRDVEFMALCPFHDEKTPSFTVTRTKQFYHCFGCGAHGNAIYFLIEYDHLSYKEAVERLAEMIGHRLPFGKTNNTRKRRRNRQRVRLVKKAKCRAKVQKVEDRQAEVRRKQIQQDRVAIEDIRSRREDDFIPF